MRVRQLSIAALAAASLSLSAAPALASHSGSGGGGGDGGAQTPPPVTTPTVDPWELCPEYLQPVSIQLPDGSSTFANVVSDAACVIARAYPSGLLTLYSLRVEPGWVATVKSAGGGNSNRIDVEFNNPATNEKRSILVAPGKTVIR